jgi:hypothetical protein
MIKVWIEAHLGGHVRMLKDRDMRIFVQIPQNNFIVHAATEEKVRFINVAAPCNV